MGKKRLSLAISAVLFLVIFPPNSIASRGGTEDKNNYFTVGFTYFDDGVSSVCSGTLIAPKVVLTAGHCAMNSKGQLGTNYLFSAPGVALDAAIDPSIVQPKVTQVITKPGFQIPGGNEVDDLAFLVLDKPLTASKFIKVATAEQVTRSSRGDSGGPVTAILANGEEVLVGVLSGAASIFNACGTMGSDGLYRMRASIVHPFLPLAATVLNSITVSPSPTTTPKTTKITCYKGKLKKIVVGVKPKCPKGYTLKK